MIFPKIISLSYRWFLQLCRAASRMNSSVKNDYIQWLRYFFSPTFMVHIHFIVRVVIQCSDLSRNEDFTLYRPRCSLHRLPSSSLFTLFRSFVCKSFDTYLPTYLSTWRFVSYLYSHERFPRGIRLRATSFLIRLFRLRSSILAKFLWETSIHSFPLLHPSRPLLSQNGRLDVFLTRTLNR